MQALSCAAHLLPMSARQTQGISKTRALKKGASCAEGYNLDRKSLSKKLLMERLCTIAAFYSLLTRAAFPPASNSSKEVRTESIWSQAVHLSFHHSMGEHRPVPVWQVHRREAAWVREIFFPYNYSLIVSYRLDPLIGQLGGIKQAPETVNRPILGLDPQDLDGQNPENKLLSLPTFIVPRGGEYFFSPSINGLKSTIASAWTSTRDSLLVEHTMYTCTETSGMLIGLLPLVCTVQH